MSSYSPKRVGDFIDLHVPDEYQVGTDCQPFLSEMIDSYLEDIIDIGIERARGEDRKRIVSRDLDVEQPSPESDLHFSVFNTHKHLKAMLPSEFQASEEATLAIIGMIEEFVETVIRCAVLLMEHADRRRLREDDLQLYFELFEQP